MLKRYFDAPKTLRLLVILIGVVTLQIPFGSLTAQEVQKGRSHLPENPAIQGARKEFLKEAISVTRHSVEVNGKSLNYTATAGYLPMEDEAGKLKANIFFVAYVKDDEDRSKRPVTFAYNGGPGASSTWLHLGALGPKRAVLAEGKTPPPPYRWETNEYTWLDFTDLVFIDPVGTGYSRPAPGVNPEEFFGVKEDIQSVGNFIRLYITRYERWLSPKFIAGESYGTTRTAGLSGYLQNRLGMNLNGIILISSVLNFQTITFTPGNDLPYILYLPSYTFAAWYHRKLPPAMQTDIRKTQQEVEQFAMNEYLLALAKGNALSHGERSRMIDTLAAYTGLPKNFIKNSNLRISRDDFLTELLRHENRQLGVLDSRITGNYQVSTFMEDPSVFQVIGPLVAVWNDYVRNELKYIDDLPYIFLSVKANRSWKWGSAAEGYVNVAETLSLAMSENRSLKVFIGSGYYDLDTAYFAATYIVNHLEIDPALQANITLAYYDAGHQMYTHLPSLQKLTRDVGEFFRKSVP
jgi:carboxypeptidase C (cathepsin A)